MMQDPMAPQPVQQVPNDVPISVDAFVARLQQRYGKMIAELMQENAEIGAGMTALREANLELRDQAAGLRAQLEAVAAEGLRAQLEANPGIAG